MSYKVALTAGHYKYTSGRRCLKAFDPNETREWVLNARICEKTEALLKEYDVSVIRTDDRSGETAVSLSDRTGLANREKVDFYLSIHHNGGINGGKGGGIVAYVYTSPKEESVEWQKALYAALIERTGLKGNRSRPLARKNLHEVREPKMPSVLLELGFMDSQTDVPIIISEEYANKCAEAIVSVIAERGGLKKLEDKPALPAFESYLVRVGVRDLYIRSGPGTDYAKKGFIKRGVYTVVEEADGKGATKWGKLKSGEGWISLDWCERI